MKTNKDVLIISASNGENLKLAKEFLKSTPNLGITAELLDLTTVPLPLFNPRNKDTNDVQQLIESLSLQMHSIPRWVICAPEYNGSIPPVLTNTIAWLSIQGTDFRNLFNGRPIAMASFSGGGCMELLVSLRIQLTHLGAQVVGRQLASNNNKPAKKDSLEDLLKRLMQMQPLNP